MVEYVNTLCMLCGDKIRKKKEINESNLKSKKKENEEDENTNEDIKKENYKSIKNFKRIRLKKENEKGKGIDYLDIDHFICINCYEKTKMNNFSGEKNYKNKKKNNNNSFSFDDESKNMNNKYYINYDEGECFCFICNKKHYLSDKIIRNGGCCTTGCNMY